MYAQTISLVVQNTSRRHRCINGCSVLFLKRDFKVADRASSAGPITFLRLFWGDRFSSITDPYGHSWSLATHIKDMTPEECQKAADEWMASMTAGGDSSETK